MKFKTALLRALGHADLISADGYEADLIELPHRPGYFCLELADETGIDFEDQDIEIEDGQTFFDDTDGEEHVLILCVERRLTEADLE